MNKAHMYDATEIFRSLPGHQKEAYFKIGFYLASFFFYLYRYVFPKHTYLNWLSLTFRMIVAFVNESELWYPCFTQQLWNEYPTV